MKNWSVSCGALYRLIKQSFQRKILYFIKFFLNIILKNHFFPTLFTLFHFRGMLHLADHNSADFICGILLHMGGILL